MTPEQMVAAGLGKDYRVERVRLGHGMSCITAVNRNLSDAEIEPSRAASIAEMLGEMRDKLMAGGFSDVESPRVRAMLKDRGFAC